MCRSGSLKRHSQCAQYSNIFFYSAYLLNTGVDRRCDQHCGRPSDIYDIHRRTKLTALETISCWLLLKKRKKSLFEPPFRALRGNVRTASMARSKASGQLYIRRNWTFFAISYGWDVMSRNRSKSAFFEGGWVTLSADFRGKGASPTNQCWCQSDCRFVRYQNIRSTSFSFVTIHASHGRTDRWTDRRTEFRQQYRALHYMQSHGKNVWDHDEAPVLVYDIHLVHLVAQSHHESRIAFRVFCVCVSLSIRFRYCTLNTSQLSPERRRHPPFRCLRHLICIMSIYINKCPQRVAVLRSAAPYCAVALRCSSCAVLLRSCCSAVARSVNAALDCQCEQQWYFREPELEVKLKLKLFLFSLWSFDWKPHKSHDEVAGNARISAS